MSVFEESRLRAPLSYLANGVVSCRFGPMTLDVRLAVESDAQGIATVHVEAWRETYAHLLPTEVLARLSVAQRAARWAEHIVALSPIVWVATDGDEIMGWATSSVGHAPDEPRDLELEGIYIRARQYGSSAGQRLLDAAIGASPAFLWVAVDNPRAHAFYRRNGFSPDGVTATRPLGGTPVAVERLVR
jgi:ribosomal protein S18 acetylase RimI-like enzyme